QFIALLAAAGEQLHTASETFREIAFTFLDTSTQVSDHLLGLLHEFQHADHHSATPGRERIEHLFRLLRLGDTPTIETAGAGTPVEAQVGFSDMTITNEVVEQPDNADNQPAREAL